MIDILLPIALAIVLISAIYYIWLIRNKNKELIKKAEQNKIELDNTLNNFHIALKGSRSSFWVIDIENNTINSYNSPINDFVDGPIDLKKCEETTHPDDKAKLNELLYNVFKGVNHKFNIVIRNQSQYDNDWQATTIDVTPLRVNDEGNVNQYVALCKNVNTTIDYAQELMITNNEKMTILQNLPIAIAIYDSEGRQEYLNDAGFSMFGVKDKAAHIAKRISIFDDPMISDEISEKIRNKENEDIVLKYDLQDANKIPGYFVSYLDESIYLDIRIRYSNLNGESDSKTILIIDDITKTVMFENELVEAKLKAESADKLKSAFLANMSHEIRTPLNAIVGFSELLQVADNKDEKKEYVEIIKNSNGYLLDLINDILDLSKIESGLLELKNEELDFNKLFEDIYLIIKNRLNNSNVELIKNTTFNSLFVMIDKVRMKQIILNFATNSIKYTKQGSITISYDYVDNGLYISVEDTGIGISDENQKKLFHRFAKLDDFAQGTGLGLSICKAITDKYNGKIGCISQEGSGSTFWAWIPCNIIKSENRFNTHSTNAVFVADK